MGLRINNNVNALTALSNLRRNDRAQQTSLERLSTGLRINRASDDPSGLVISEKLRAQITSLNQALENTQNDINLINTAEAALAEISDVLVDMRSGVIFALNTGFASGEQIRAEQDKINQSLVAIDRIAHSTRFAGRGLLNGDSDFIIETEHAEAFDDLTVRSARLAPSTSLQTFSVNISQLAERATLITNFSVGSDRAITSLKSGGNLSDMVTLRVRGASGSADLLMGNGSTIGDLVNAINQNASATGVFASSFQPINLDSGSAEFIIAGAGSGIQMNGKGQDLIFGIQVGGGAVQTLVINSGADDLVTGAELLAALNPAIDTNFEVFSKDGDLVIRNRASNFTIAGAKNVRTYTLTKSQISTMFLADEGGSAVGTFGDATAIGFDIDGDGSIGGAGEQFTFANLGGLGVDNPDDVAALVAAVRGMADFGGNVAVHTDADGNLVVIDTTGSTMGSAGTSSVGIVNQGGDDDIVAAAINGSRDVTSYTGTLVKLGIAANIAEARDEAISFINFEVPSGFSTLSGNLEIPASAVSGGSLDFNITDANNVAGIAVSVAAGADLVISLNEIQTALNGVSGGVDDSRTQYQVYFDKVGGLTIVDRFGGAFTINEAIADTDMAAVFGRANSASTSNAARIALLSTEFGTEQVISIEDVTSPTSDLSLIDELNGGLSITGDGRSGLGALSGTANTFAGLKGSRIQGIGKDIQGNISGLAFAGKGFGVSFVTSSLDVEFTLAENFGLSGVAGRRADASRFGFSDNAGIDGSSRRASLYAGVRLPNGYLDRIQFAIRQNFPGGARNISGMRFQIRETNNATDSLLLGIRQISTGTLGQNLTPELTDKNAASFTSRFRGGALNTLRTGAGSDLIADPANALEIVDRAINQVTALRSFLGSVSADTLQRNLNSVGVAVENLTGAQSFIRDLDFAAETTNFTKSQIMFQASTSVLSAANSIPQVVLSLLTGI